jgi:thiol-disulfide isomerase/thioredoxin
MSTRAERRRQERNQDSAPKRSLGRLIAGGVLVLGVIAIIVYAYVQHNAQVSGAAVAPSAAATMPPPKQPGMTAPPFSIVSVSGEAFSNATFAGKPYMLEIFATWCPHCQRMTVVLRDIRAKFPLSRFGMLSVTGSPIASSSTADNLIPEDQNDVQAFDSVWNVTWPSAFDKDLTVAKTWGLTGFPDIFIVDKTGKIVYQSSGEVPEKKLVIAIEKTGA